MIDPRRIEVIDDVSARIYRAMSPSRKMELLDDMYRFCIEIVESGVRSAHPQWTDSQVQDEVRRRVRLSNQSGEAA